jgi:hypothetical protein
MLRAYIALTSDPAARVQSPTRFGEYTAQRVTLGNFEYVEMTVGW